MYKNIYETIQKKYIRVFEENWNKLMDALFFQQAQFNSGNRLRPYIVLMGYLSTKDNLALSEQEYYDISQISICIELIHKSSLILDDLIDNDPARHGKMAFHIEYGLENTMMFAVNLLSVAVKRMNKFIQNSKKHYILKEKGINLLSKIMYDMSLGELEELSLDNISKYDYKKVQDIIYLETSTLISNSLLLGYYAGNGESEDVEKTLKSIGRECGYIFQVMNDMEPFCQQIKIKQHKGRLNTDILQTKKNIVLALMYNLISLDEKNEIEAAKSVDDINSLVIKYFNFYKIKDTFMREIKLIHYNIYEQIDNLRKYGISSNWCTLFKTFIDTIIQECKNRLL